MTDQLLSTGDPARVVLEGVPWVGFYRGGPRCPEDVAFPSCLRASLEYLGEHIGCQHIAMHDVAWQCSCAYAYLLGTSCCAFRLSWRPGWHLDNVEIMTMSDDPAAPFRRAFESVGYAYEIIEDEEGRDNKAYFCQRIVESIRDKGRPVLAFGIIGPPECCLVTGYDEGGDVLIGWNFFQESPEFNAGVEFEPSGYFRKRDWFIGTDDSLIVIGDKQERPPLGAVYREALRWALQVVRTPVTWGDRHNGLAAYAAWAEQLTHDDEFPAGDDALLRERHSVHHNAVGEVAEGRWYGSLFLAQVAGQEPAMAEELLMAAACYAAEHDLMWQVWNLVGGIDNPEAYLKLAEPGMRRQIVPVILQARDRDAEAADHIERALAQAGKPPA